MDFGAAGRNHSREECQSRIASSWQESQGLQVGRGRVGGEGLPAQGSTAQGDAQGHLCAEAGGCSNSSKGKGKGAGKNQAEEEGRREVGSEIQEQFNKEEGS